ncbi:MAG: DUF5908 family protein [Burkholderiaceae bacterium]
MPVIIDEVVIHVSVENTPTAPGMPAGQGAAAMQPDDRQTLIAECAERVLELLHRQKEA